MRSEVRGRGATERTRLGSGSCHLVRTEKEWKVEETDVCNDCNVVDARVAPVA